MSVPSPPAGPEASPALWTGLAASVAAVPGDPEAVQALAGTLLQAVRATDGLADVDGWEVLRSVDGSVVMGPDLVVLVTGPASAPMSIEVHARDRLLYVADAGAGVLAAQAGGSAAGRPDPGPLDGVHVHVRLVDGVDTMVDASFPAGGEPEDHLDDAATARRVEQRIAEAVADVPVESLDGPVAASAGVGVSAGRVDAGAGGRLAAGVTAGVGAAAAAGRLLSSDHELTGHQPAPPVWTPTHTLLGEQPHPVWATREEGETRAWWLGPNAPVRLLVLDEGWAQVEDRSGRIGWLQATALHETRSQSPTGPWAATHTVLRPTGVWERPDPRWSASAQLAAGLQVRLLDVHDGWAHVDVGSGHQGWLDLTVLDALE